MIGTKVTLRLRMSAHDAHYAGELVDGGRILSLFGDLATELLIRLDGDEGLFRAYETVEFLAPVFAGDYIEAVAELVAIGNTSRKLRFEARKVVANLRVRSLAPSAADVLAEPLVVARAVGTCVTPKELQRRPPGLYMPGLPAGPEPGTDPLVTPPMPEDVILTAAIGLPITPQDVADEAARCREAGAAVIHLHARNPDGSSASSAARFAEVIDAVRRKCDCVLQPTTGGSAGASVDERSGALASKPEMAALPCGSFNSGDDVSVTSRRDLRALAGKLRAAGAMPALECYEVGHVEEALALAAERVLDKPMCFQLVLGVKGAIPAREDVVCYLRSLLPSDATWGVAATFRSQQAMTELAMRLGGHARVGLEDDVDVGKGALSEGSAPLVARAAAYARALGRSPADPSRARQLLGLPDLRVR